MVESDAEVLVKEGRRPEAILSAVPPPIFLKWWPATSLFPYFFYLRLCPSRNKIP
jgi:hypothetical protein